MDDRTIKSPRTEIDEIDTEILRLLNKRAEIALRVGAAKKTVETSLLDPKRESEVLSRLSDINPGPFENQNVTNIFQRIIDESLLLQQKTFRIPSVILAQNSLTKIADESRVGFLGEHGSFSEEAALKILGKDCKTVSFPTFDELYQAIDLGKADYILSPLENSLVGSLHKCFDLLLESSLSIAAEVILPISHYLIACPEATMQTIQMVESHPAALAQCERFFAAHPILKAISSDDTAGSVKRAVESGDPACAAIGGKRTAEIYGGKILRERIENHAENYTRFVLLSKEPDLSNKGAKVSLVVKLSNKPGALHDALRPFVRRGIDLLKIESRPIKDEPSNFNFYMDLQAPASESELSGALKDIGEIAVNVRYLGRYSKI